MALIWNEKPRLIIEETPDEAATLWSRSPRQRPHLPERNFIGRDISHVNINK